MMKERKLKREIKLLNFSSLSSLTNLNQYILIILIFQLFPLQNTNHFISFNISICKSSYYCACKSACTLSICFVASFNFDTKSCSSSKLHVNSTLSFEAEGVTSGDPASGNLRFFSVWKEMK
jgi:hypothetical protein